MAKRSGDFDDDEGFFESLMKRKDSVPMPDSMAKIFKTIIAACVLIIVSLVAWAVWPNGDKMSADSVPVVRAESGDYKVEPDDKGGMIIPNKDSTIFETMDHDAKPEKKVESLLEDSEQPMKKEEAFVEGTVPAAEAPVTAQDTETESVPPEKLVEDVVKPEPAAIVKEESKIVADTKPVVKEEPKVAAVVPDKKKVNIIDALKEETGSKKADVAKAAKGSVYIQLAAVKSEADAKTKWAKLKSSHQSLSSLSLKVQKADLGAKGVFYRVQAGPTSADNAASICAKIKSAKGDCIVAK
ncbi:MAG TPA: hypothetical protein DCM27_07735 [Rhodospirillaceae bacterium]|nr:hypothetical protein [Rhodospirillaceae bacterium]